MITSICLLSCVLTLGQATDRAEWQLSPQLTPGLELVYTGTYLEEALIPNVQHQRHYRLETNLLVLDVGMKDWHAAFMTALSLQDPRLPFNKKTMGPTSMRLELAQVDHQGRIRKKDNKFLEVPVKGPPTLESGFLLAVPLVKVGRNSGWEVAEAGRAPLRWQILGTESLGGITCIKIMGMQQSDDWDRPRADQSAWRRRETVWILPQLNVAQKVERTIERRDPARDAPTERVTIRYELESHLRYPGRLFEERREEMLKACKFHEDAQALLRQPAQHRPQIDSLIQRVSFQLERQDNTPYRKAVVHIKTMLENAKKGEGSVPSVAEEPIPASVQTLDVGQRVPDFSVSSLTEPETTQFKRHHGKPVLVLFYNPATNLGKEVIEYAKQLSEKNKGQLAVLALAVTQDTELVRKQHQELRLPFPILDGNGMRQTFGAVETPRFVLIDSDGVVRLTQTGLGFQVPVEIGALLPRCQKK